MTPEEKMINDRLTEIWEQYVKTGHYKTDYAPLYRADLRHNGLLFVGLNPSFNTSHPSIKNYSFPIGSKSRSGSNAFGWDPSWTLNTDPTRIDSLGHHERRVSTPNDPLYYKTYFSTFETIRDEVVIMYPNIHNNNKLNTLTWEYSDIFFFREKNQKNAMSLIYNPAPKGTKKTLTPFVKAQLEVFRQLVCAINPKAIIMNNALASDIVLSHFTVSKFDTAAGCYWWEECSGHWTDDCECNWKEDCEGNLKEDCECNLKEECMNKIPLFARGTMQYGRLDSYEKERLVWHIARTI